MQSPPPDESERKSALSAGFTLIELSIVLVIIGLVVGGVLVGQHLIQAAKVRATISQIEKYNQAVNTFYGKYQALPGDMNAPTATQWGFPARGTLVGQGDGNGIIEGTTYDGRGSGVLQDGGESVMFWVDLSTANLIEGSFNTAQSTASQGATIPSANMNLWFPEAKLGTGNYVFVMGGTGGVFGYMNFALAGPNYFVVEQASSVGVGSYGLVNGTYYDLTVQQAYSIDNKIDDGRPTSGRVLALMLGTQATWTNYQGPPTNTHVPNNSGNCYNNGAVDGATMVYSLTYSNIVACSLAFQFQ